MQSLNSGEEINRFCSQLRHFLIGSLESGAIIEGINLLTLEDGSEIPEEDISKNYFYGAEARVKVTYTD